MFVSSREEVDVRRFTSQYSLPLSVTEVLHRRSGVLGEITCATQICSLECKRVFRQSV